MCWHRGHAQKDSTLVGKPYTTSTMLQGRPLQQKRLFNAGCRMAEWSGQPLGRIPCKLINSGSLRVEACIGSMDWPLALLSSRLLRQARRCAVECASLG